MKKYALIIKTTRIKKKKKYFLYTDHQLKNMILGVYTISSSTWKV